MRTRRALRLLLAFSVACSIGTLGAPAGSSLSVHREVIDDRNAGDCTETADLDGDGLPDVVNGGGWALAANPLRAYLGPALAPTVVAEPPVGTVFTGGCALADVDGDGDIDLVAVLAPAAPTPVVTAVPAVLRWMENPGGAGLGPWQPHDVAPHPAGVPGELSAADFDGDGRIELVARSTRALAIFSRTGPGATDSGPADRGPADGDAPWLAEVLPTAGGAGLLSADADADGDIDLLAGGVLLENRPDGSWPAAPVGGSASASAAVADLDGDGRPEIVLGPLDDSGPLTVFRLGDDGWLASPVAASSAGAVHHLELADLDHEGDPDLVVAAPRRALTAYLNQGGGHTWTATTLDPDGLYDFAVTDLDGDHHLDIVGSNGAGSAPLIVLRGTASAPPTGTTPEPLTATGEPTPVPTSTSIATDPSASLGEAPPGQPDTAPGVPSDVTTPDGVALGSSQVSTVPVRESVMPAVGAVDPSVEVLPAVLERRPLVPPSVTAAHRSGAMSMGPLIAALAATLLAGGWLATNGRHRVGAALERIGATIAPPVGDPPAGH